MGVTPSLFSMLNTAMALTNCQRMIELGNQHFHDTCQMLETHDGTWVVKKWAEARGIDHVSIDTNGQDGALPLDLTVPIMDLKPADIVTNFGTSEHVGPDGQEECFANIARLCTVRGLVLHALPLRGHWAGHSDVTYPEHYFDGVSTTGSMIMHPLASWIDTGCGPDKHQICAIVRRTQ